MQKRSYVSSIKQEYRLLRFILTHFKSAQVQSFFFQPGQKSDALNTAIIVESRFRVSYFQEELLNGFNGFINGT